MVFYGDSRVSVDVVVLVVRSLNGILELVVNVSYSAFVFRRLGLFFIS